MFDTIKMIVSSGRKSPFEPHLQGGKHLDVKKVNNTKTPLSSLIDKAYDVTEAVDLVKKWISQSLMQLLKLPSNKR